MRHKKIDPETRKKFGTPGLQKYKSWITDYYFHVLEVNY